MKSYETDILWRAGDLSYTLRRGQMEVYSRIKAYKAKNPNSIKPFVLNARRRYGKAQPLSSKVLTCDGWKTMGEIQLGDVIYTPSGRTSKVVGVYPQGEKQIYTITFHDGSKVECCLEHLWQVNVCPGRNPWEKDRNSGGWAKSISRILDTQQMIDYLACRNKPGYKNHPYLVVPLVSPIPYQENVLPIHPYLLGVLLGDGCFRGGTPMLTTKDDWILDRIKPLLPLGVVSKLNSGSKIDYNLSSGGSGRRYSNKLTTQLKLLGLWRLKSHQKFIPNIYKSASIEQRLSLLQGLMDSDGTTDKRGTPSYTTTSHQLVTEIQEMISSLGGLATIYHRKAPSYTYKGQRRLGKEAWTLHIAFPTPKDLFTLPRKKDRALALFANGRHTLGRRIISILPSSKQQAQCIAIDDPDRLYITDNYTVTHNTYLLLTLLVEKCQRTPGAICKFAAPYYKWARELAEDTMQEILTDCPSDLLPKRRDLRFHFPNGSKLDIIGVDTDDANRLRGRRADWVGVDEAGYTTRLEYIVRSVIIPQFEGVEEPCLMIASTPPEEGEDHDFVRTYINQATEETYCFYPVYKDPDWTQDKEERVLSEGITKESAHWRREYLCETTSDPERLIIPEYINKDLRSLIEVDNYPRPTHFYPYIGIDFGLLDHSAVLYTYHDFANDIWVIEDELWSDYWNTKELAEEMIKKEQELYTNTIHKQYRYGDNNRQQIWDLTSIYKLHIEAADKYDKEGAINSLRVRIGQGKVRIFKRCIHLLEQLRGGIFNKARTKFERSERLGHCDSIDAAVYANRMINFKRNPFPIEYPKLGSQHINQMPNDPNKGWIDAFRPTKRKGIDSWRLKGRS